MTVLVVGSQPEVDLRERWRKQRLVGSLSMTRGRAIVRHGQDGAHPQGAAVRPFDLVYTSNIDVGPAVGATSQTVSGAVPMRGVRRRNARHARPKASTKSQYAEANDPDATRGHHKSGALVWPNVQWNGFAVWSRGD